MEYKSIHDVPRGFRRINGAPLTLDQINTLFTAVEKMAKPDGSDFAACLGVVRQEFRDTHDMTDGHWVKKGGGA